MTLPHLSVVVWCVVYGVCDYRAGYTHKTAGLAVNGTLTFVPSNRIKAEHSANQAIVNEPFIGAGLTDYTRSQVRMAGQRAREYLHT